MSWFTPAKNLSKKAINSLKSLANSGSSEYTGVADILNTIASNDKESAQNDFLATCAEQIIEAAQGFLIDIGHNSTARKLYTDEDRYICFDDGHVVWVLHSCGWEAFTSHGRSCQTHLLSTGQMTLPTQTQIEDARNKVKITQTPRKGKNGKNN